MISRDQIRKLAKGAKLKYLVDSEEGGIESDVELVKLDLDAADGFDADVKLTSLKSQWGKSYLTAGTTVRAKLSELTHP